MVGMFLFALIMRRGRRDEREAAAGMLSVEDATQSALAAADPELPLDEAHIPRWRRPSVQAARQSSRFGPPVSRPALRFAAPASTGVERVAVHYRFVRVADAPDDVRSVELGRLDRGDEVDVLDRRTGFALVRAPDGLEGWVPRMTLGQLDFAGD